MRQISWLATCASFAFACAGEIDLPDDTATTAAIDDGAGAPYPIVLVHGMAGFVKISRLNLSYFNGVAVELRERAGEEHVFEARIPALASTPVRAAQLKPFVDHVLAQTGKAKVNIVAHSQGGLDARYLVSSLGYAAKVASVTTIATPHHGSRIADALLKALPTGSYKLLDPMLELYGLAVGQADSESKLRETLVSLSEEHVERVFNPANPDARGVRYYSYAGRSNLAGDSDDCDGAEQGNDGGRDIIDPLLLVTGGYLSIIARQVNDGLVSVRSARHGRFQKCVPADHFDLVGQIGDRGRTLAGFDHKAFYREVVADLRARGH